MDYNIIKQLVQLRISTKDEVANVEQLLIIDAMLNPIHNTSCTEA